MTRRILAGLAGAVLALGLAGCSADWLLRDDASGAPTPAESSSPDPEPSLEPSESPTAAPDCDGPLVIDLPGTYRLGECDSLVLEGTGIEVEALRIGELVLRGDRNTVEVRGAIGSVAVRGNFNSVTSQTEIGPITESGQGNDFSVTP